MRQKTVRFSDSEHGDAKPDRTDPRVRGTAAGRHASRGEELASPRQSCCGGPGLVAFGLEGQLIRAGRGVYLLPVMSRFRASAPSVEQSVKALAAQRGEVIVPSGAAAANSLGLTAQVPIRSVYLTSGRTRQLTVGKRAVELRHAPCWQLALPHGAAGQAVRALAWLGPEKVEAALAELKRKLPPAVFNELVAVAPQLPTWLASSVGQIAYG